MRLQFDHPPAVHQVTTIFATLWLMVGCASSSSSTFDPTEAHQRVVTTQRTIVTGTLPISLVIHTVTGEWIFLSTEVSDEYSTIDTRITTTLDVLIKLDPSINQLASLPNGWKAMRKSASDPWSSMKLKEFDVIQN